MKKVTLELTKQETNSIWDKTNSNTLEFFYLMECYDKNKTFTHYECEVFNVAKFREFLKDEVRYYNSGTDFDVDMVQVELKNVKSILSKLDLAVNKNKKYKISVEHGKALLDCASMINTDGKVFDIVHDNGQVYIIITEGKRDLFFRNLRYVRRMFMGLTNKFDFDKPLPPSREITGNEFIL